ncbi:hypothetical protein [Leptospira mayottensis]|uniref:Uncharacterized protein n=1 Tax=Leptospira mayottensis 200901122 TaxID=1193010 RepID=A0AA87MRQ3_9LEPT|nr:hypothetical protein [Leptospira mayottensis]EKS01181.1 hypothetical protein LEP1GSC125_1170 [Leptospira mayottensis 200901122]
MILFTPKSGSGKYSIFFINISDSYRKRFVLTGNMEKWNGAILIDENRSFGDSCLVWN